MTGYSLYDHDEPNVDGLERAVYDEISTEEPWALIEAFSELDRVSGTEDERKAAEYIRDRLAIHDVEHEVYSPELFISQPKSANVTVTGAGENFGSAKTVSFSADGTASGEPTFLEMEQSDNASGAFDVGLSLDQLDVDVEGKVVIMESILPINTITELAENGAEAFVGIHPPADEPHEGIASPVWGGIPDPSGELDHPDIVIANLSKSDGQRLRSMIDAGSVDELEVSAEVTTGWYECPVIVARINGQAAPDNDRFVLFHGHYDSWYQGITDNATGDAGLLEAARVFDQFSSEIDRDIWIAWWPGHSTGRYAGSTWFTDEFAIELANRCVAHVNMDSPGVKDATEYFVRPKWMPEADRLCREVINDVAGKETEENRPPRSGDYSFNNLGIPGMSIQSVIPEELRSERGYHAVGGSGGHAEAWHLTTDTIEKADPETLVRDLRVYMLAVLRLANEDYLPLQLDHAISRNIDFIDDYIADVGDHFDFKPVHEELKSLQESVADFSETVQTEAISSTEANRKIMAVSRLLTRANFVSEGPFDQDPAYNRPPFPALAPARTLGRLSGDEYNFQRVHLRRARNEIVHNIKKAQRILDR